MSWKKGTGGHSHPGGHMAKLEDSSWKRRTDASTPRHASLPFCRATCVGEGRRGSPCLPACTGVMGRGEKGLRRPPALPASLPPLSCPPSRWVCPSFPPRSRSEAAASQNFFSGAPSGHWRLQVSAVEAPTSVSAWDEPPAQPASKFPADPALRYSLGSEQLWELPNAVVQSSRGMFQSRLLAVLLMLVMCLQRPSGQTTKVLFENWKTYSKECYHNMSLMPPPTELVCNRTFDNYSCWPDAQPNTTAKVFCPWYLPWYDQVKHGYVFQKCGPDGQWVTGPNRNSSRDAHQCANNQTHLEQEIFASIKVMYTVGYSVSLCALILALAVLLGFSKLHCVRNYIHMNLFASFILKSISVLVVDTLLKTHFSRTIDNNSVVLWLSHETAAGCRAATVFMQYSIVANYCWLLVEGIYLHNLLALAFFSEHSYFTHYLFIGWGAPVFFVVPWVVVKFLYENIQCWSTNNNMGFWWILRFPVFLAILINFFIFIRIIKILVSKLCAHQMRSTDYKFRLAKSTLTLIPLLGIHEVVFAFVTDEHARGTLRYVKLFFDLFLGSFQGMLVAILYCFVNKEVQSELMKKWTHWKLGQDIEEEYKHTYSHISNTRNKGTSTCENHKQAGNYLNGLGHSQVTMHTSTQYLERTACSASENLAMGERPHCYEFPETAESNF